MRFCLSINFIIIFFWLSSRSVLSWGIILTLVCLFFKLMLVELLLMFTLHAYMLLTVSYRCLVMPSDAILSDRRRIVAELLPGICLFYSLTSGSCLSCSAKNYHGFPSRCTLYSWIRRGPFPLRGITWWQYPSHHNMGERWCTHQRGHRLTDHHQCHRADHQFNWPFNKWHWHELHWRVYVHSLWWVHYCQG